MPEKFEFSTHSSRTDERSLVSLDGKETAVVIQVCADPTPPGNRAGFDGEPSICTYVWLEGRQRFQRERERAAMNNRQRQQIDASIVLEQEPQNRETQVLERRKPKRGTVYFSNSQRQQQQVPWAQVLIMQNRGNRRDRTEQTSREPGPTSGSLSL